MINYENLASSNEAFLSEIDETVSRVIKGGWYILGKEVECFEQEFSEYIGANYCVGVGNGLEALTLSFEALDIPKQSEILVASNTYIATILAIIRAGHKPVLVEPDICTYNLNPFNLESYLTSKTAAICVTHLFGKSCRMDLITSFAAENNLYLVEDCAQSHGAQFRGKTTGTFGIAGCFSFYPTKNLGALGDAGCILTNNAEFANKLRCLRNYGSSKKYHNELIGYNSRLDELQAAILRIKLKHLDAVTQHKRSLAEIYFKSLPDWLILPTQQDDEFDVFHIFAVRLKERDKLRECLFDKGIKTEIHYPIPPHKQKAMQGILSGHYPIAEELHSTELSLPISFGTKKSEVNFICSTLSALSQDIFD